VVVWAGAAACAAALGAVPFAGGRRPPLAGIGWANALAAGLMLGASYILIMLGLDRSPVAAAGGALLGIAFVALAHAVTGPEGTRVFVRNSLHAAPEGMAIGGAMAVDLPFGAFMALAIAVHNVPEGAALSAALTGRGLGAVRAAVAAGAAKANQMLLAVATYALVAGFPALLPWALGGAAGAFLYLIMADLLPESYRQAGRTSIGLVVAVAMAILVLLARRVPLP
jgi:hypothetical protein